jgi:hypothetical protein
VAPGPVMLRTIDMPDLSAYPACQEQGNIFTIYHEYLLYHKLFILARTFFIIFQ